MSADKALLIDVDDVSIQFGTEKVIDRISLGIRRGEFVGLIGPNGAGKTTLLRALLKLQSLSTGRITHKNATISYIPQRGNQYSAIVPISVLEVVRLSGSRSTTSAMEALEAVGMTAAAHRRFNELSGGQQQRIAIAKAIASDTEVLLLDEPTTGIDEHSQTEFFSLLRTLQQKNITIIMVSHEVDTVLSLVTRVICLNRTIVYDGPPEHFEADKYLPAFYKDQHLRLHHRHGEDHV